MARAGPCSEGVLGDRCVFTSGKKEQAVEDRVYDETTASKIVVDFAAQKTEAGWQTAWDLFWLKFTPHWFAWLGWATLLGGLVYVWRVTKVMSVLIVISLSGVFILMYLHAFFFRFDFRNVALVRQHRALAVLASLLFCVVLSTGAYLLLNGVANAFSDRGKSVDVQKCSCGSKQEGSVRVGPNE